MTPAETIEAAKLMTEWAQSVIDGKPIEIESLTNQGWKEVSPEWNWQLAHYRRKPQPKRVPLEAKDVSPGSVVRGMIGCWQIVTAVVANAIYIAGDGAIWFEQLQKDNWQISRDNGKTWEPCWKEQV